MKFHPKGPFIVGRIVDVVRGRHGVQLPDVAMKNITVMLLVDDVGEDVKRCKVGDLILYFKMSHIYLRNGFHAAVVHDEDVISTVEVDEQERGSLKVEGDGAPELAAPYADDSPVVSDRPPLIARRS